MLGEGNDWLPVLVYLWLRGLKLLKLSGLKITTVISASEEVALTQGPVLGVPKIAPRVSNH